MRHRNLPRCVLTVENVIVDNAAHPQQLWMRYDPPNLPSCRIHELSSAVDSDGFVPVVAYAGKRNVLDAIECQKVVYFVREDEAIWVVLEDVSYGLKLLSREALACRVVGCVQNQQPRFVGKS